MADFAQLRGRLLREEVHGHRPRCRSWCCHWNQSCRWGRSCRWKQSRRRKRSCRRNQSCCHRRRCRRHCSRCRQNQLVGLGARWRGRVTAGSEMRGGSRGHQQQNLPGHPNSSACERHEQAELGAEGVGCQRCLLCNHTRAAKREGGAQRGGRMPMPEILQMKPLPGRCASSPFAAGAERVRQVQPDGRCHAN